MQLLRDSFPSTDEGRILRWKVRRALRNITGRGLSNEGRTLHTPLRLDAERDTLKEDWQEIWRNCTLEYDENEGGASITGKKRIRIGPFFLQKRFDVAAMEKVILHEYLHAALAIEWKEAQHGMMEQILKYNLKYPGPANVGSNVD